METGFELYREMNRIALAEYMRKEGDSAKVCQILIFNQQLYRNFFTTHNLGAFLFLEGCLPARVTPQETNALALKHLKRALRYERHFLTLFALSELFCERRQYQRAVGYIKEAIAMCDDYRAVNHLGALYMLQRKYSDAADTFRAAHTLCEDEADRYNLLFSETLARYKCGAPERTALFRALADDAFVEFFESDMIALAYLMKEHEFIKKYHEHIYKTSYKSEIDAQMIEAALADKRIRIKVDDTLLLPRQVKCLCILLDCPMHPAPCRL